MYIQSLAVISCLNDQYGVSSFVYFILWGWPTIVNKILQCTKVYTFQGYLLISSIDMLSGMAMHDSIALIVMCMLSISLSVFDP